MPQEIPEHAWNYLPKEAEYIRNCLKFCGYNNIDAIIKLEKEEEVKKMFDFVVKMKHAVRDREKVFGIFESNPEDIMVLPGLQPFFDKFVQGVKRLKKTGKDPNKLDVKSRTIVKAKKRIVPKVVQIPRVEDIEQQMRNWMSKHEVKEQFKIQTTENPANFEYSCHTCSWKGQIVLDSEGKVCLSNVQRHYRKNRCLNRPSSSNASSTSSSKKMQNFYKPIDSLPKAQPRSKLKLKQTEKVFEDGVDFTPHGTNSTDKSDIAADVTENEKNEYQEKDPKNLQLPVGHHENIEPNGH